MLPIDLTPDAPADAAPASEAARQPHVPFSNSYARLPAQFFTRIDPTPVAQPRLIKFNEVLAAQLGVDVAGLEDAVRAAVFSGNTLLPGSEPIAMAYAGHQFGQFVPQLGDGRAILLGEVLDTAGKRRDLQLKGSGRTPYSRGGDGRAAVGPVLREYLVSEAMAALGIPATRALAAVTTGEFVFRDKPVPGAILTRVAASHIRVGTFQFFAARGDADAVKCLADYAIERHYPEAAAAQNPYLELLRSVTERQAQLIAAWMQVGFIHGVMNTDNMTISGETIDFGPCAFMDAYDPATVFSSIDHRGRYAYSNQPPAAQWNLARFAETLLPLIDPDSERAIEQAGAVITEFSSRFEAHWLAGMRAKLGLFHAEAADADLARGLLDTMQRNSSDFTLTFRRLCEVAAMDEAEAMDAVAAMDKAETVDEAAAMGAVAAMGNAAAMEQAAPGTAAARSEAAAQGRVTGEGGFAQWAVEWRLRLAREPQSGAVRAAAMRRVNPAYIPRNHRIEQAIVAAEHEDFGSFEELLCVLSKPFEEQAAFAAYATPPLPAERVLQTFCGT